MTRRRSPKLTRDALVNHVALDACSCALADSLGEACIPCLARREAAHREVREFRRLRDGFRRVYGKGGSAVFGPGGPFFRHQVEGSLLSLAQQAEWARRRAENLRVIWGDPSTDEVLSILAAIPTPDVLEVELAF